MAHLLAPKWWNTLVIEMDHSVVVCDTAALEMLHWSGILSSTGKCEVTGTHLTTDPVIEYHGAGTGLLFMIGDADTLSSITKTVERWLCSETLQVTVTSLLNLETLKVFSGKDNPDCYYLDILSNLSNIYPTTIFNFTLSPVPCFFPTDHALITPTARDLFPLTRSDLHALSAWLKSRGEARSLERDQVITMAMLPATLQLQIKMLAEELGHMFDEMGVAEDCYCVGSLSRVLADQLVSTVGHRPDRRYSSKMSVVFIDRTLDLFNVSSSNFKHTAELLFNNSEELFPGSNDVRVDLRRLFNKPKEEFVISGSVSESRSAVPMTTLLSSDHTTLVDQILSSLENGLQVEPDILASRDLSTILPETDMFSKIENFPYFQILTAISECLNSEDRSIMEHFHTTDHSLLWTSLEDSVLVGQLANSILERFSDHPSLTPLHIATLLIHLYSLFGHIVDETSETDAIELAKLKLLFFRKLKDGTDSLSSSLNSPGVSDEKLHRKIDDLFTRIGSIAQSRKNLSQLKDIATRSGTPCYQSILEQVIELCLNQDPASGLTDIEYRSGGLRDLLKTGLGLFTRSVAKPRPTCPLLVYMVGGVSVSEMRWVEEYRQRTGRNVMIGGTCILNHQKLAQKLLVNDNVFGV